MTRQDGGSGRRLAAFTASSHAKTREGEHKACVGDLYLSDVVFAESLLVGPQAQLPSASTAASTIRKDPPLHQSRDQMDSFNALKFPLFFEVVRIMLLANRDSSFTSTG